MVVSRLSSSVLRIEVGPLVLSQESWVDASRDQGEGSFGSLLVTRERVLSVLCSCDQLVRIGSMCLLATPLGRHFHGLAAAGGPRLGRGSLALQLREALP